MWYKINEYRLKIRDREKKKLKEKLEYLERNIKRGKMSTKDSYRLLSGHLWYINIANVNNLCNKLFVI